MLNQNNRPGFGKPLKTPSYYLQVKAFIEQLRSTTTHRNIADLLNRAGYLSPAGKPWDRQKISNFLRQQQLN